MFKMESLNLKVTRTKLPAPPEPQIVYAAAADKSVSANTGRELAVNVSASLQQSQYQ